MKKSYPIQMIASIFCIALFASCAAQRAYYQEAHTRSFELQEKARSGQLLTTREWQMLLTVTPYEERTTGWLFGLIGRPDETISGRPRFYFTFAIFKNKCLNEITGKPEDLCLAISDRNDGVGDSVYDARRVRNL